MHHNRVSRSRLPQAHAIALAASLLACVLCILAACSSGEDDQQRSSKADKPGATPDQNDSAPAGTTERKPVAAAPLAFGELPPAVTSQPAGVFPEVTQAERNLLARMQETHREVRIILLNRLDGEIFPCGCSDGQRGGLMRAAGYIEAWKHTLNEEGVEHHVLAVGDNVDSEASVWRPQEEMPYFAKRAQFIEQMIQTLEPSAFMTYFAQNVMLDETYADLDPSEKILPHQRKETSLDAPPFQVNPLEVWYDDSCALAFTRAALTARGTPASGSVTTVQVGSALPESPQVVLLLEPSSKTLERVLESAAKSFVVVLGGPMLGADNGIIEPSEFLGDRGVYAHFDQNGARKLPEIRLFLPKQGTPKHLTRLEYPLNHERRLLRDELGEAGKSSSRRALDELISSEHAFVQIRNIEMGDDVQISARVRQAYHRFTFSLERDGLMRAPEHYFKPDAYVSSCATCHPKMVEAYKEHSPHMHAWEALDGEARKDPFCRSCHITYDDPGVMIHPAPGGKPHVHKSASNADVYEGVQCSHCHLQARAHQVNPGTYKTILAPKEDCMRCHNEKQAPNFDLESAWEKLACVIAQNE